jgi:hypothetical protein
MTIFGKAWPWRFFVTRSDAMRPSIFAGDVLVVRKSSHKSSRKSTHGSKHSSSHQEPDYGVGDVIAYDTAQAGMSPSVRRICMVMHPSNGVTKYVVRRDADGLVADSIVDASHVIGEVAARLVNVGRIVEGSAGRSQRSLSSFATAPNARRTSATSHSSGDARRTSSASDSAAE